MPVLDALAKSLQAIGPIRSDQPMWKFRLYKSKADTTSAQSPDKTSLWFLFWTFLKIGSVAFGGFMSLISFIETIIVKRYKLISHEEMLDAISLANLLPGPQAVNVVAFVGYRLRGSVGALITTTSIILPSFFLVLALSYFYFQYGDIPALQKAFLGFIPAIAAIVFSVVWRMGKKTITGKKEIALLLVSLLIMIATPMTYRIYAPIMIIALCAFMGYVFFYDRNNISSEKEFSKFPIGKIIVPLSLLSILFLLWFVPLPFENNSLMMLALTFASMSLILFGGGYVFIPIIGSIVVLQYGWVTQQEFTDGIAMGQITPGPILISATFIGYKVAGLAGALLSTVAIFGPPAILMISAARVLDFIKQSPVTQAAIHGVHCGVIGLILVAAFVILNTAVPAWPFEIKNILPTLVILIAAMIALMKFKLDVVWIIPAAGILGYLMY
jgi:chromate transporter